MVLRTARLRPKDQSEGEEVRLGKSDWVHGKVKE